jgi:hypothetical protein
MSPRSIYLRDQADKCRRHAENIGDADTQEQLRILAAEYIMSAVAIESEAQLRGSHKAASNDGCHRRNKSERCGH